MHYATACFQQCDKVVITVSHLRDKETKTFAQRPTVKNGGSKTQTQVSQDSKDRVCSEPLHDIYVQAVSIWKTAKMSV